MLVKRNNQTDSARQRRPGLGAITFQAIMYVRVSRLRDQTRRPLDDGNKSARGCGQTTTSARTKMGLAKQLSPNLQRAVIAGEDYELTPTTV